MCIYTIGGDKTITLLGLRWQQYDISLEYGLPYKIASKTSPRQAWIKPSITVKARILNGKINNEWVNVPSMVITT